MNRQRKTSSSGKLILQMPLKTRNRNPVAATPANSQDPLPKISFLAVHEAGSRCYDAVAAAHGHHKAGEMPNRIQSAVEDCLGTTLYEVNADHLQATGKPLVDDLLLAGAVIGSIYAEIASDLDEGKREFIG